ncbi:MAG: zf-HC2 domain-containing protein, partial [Candidatus Eisenbacteria sp.]|nr:zf-HC2 domain-containing protein [Candidatus Eisenbacteria bacterium]
MKSQCDKIRSELDRFLDEDLPNRDRLRVAEHLKNCPDCRAELERERQLMDAMAELPRLRCPERVIQQIERDICQQIERDICQ